VVTEDGELVERDADPEDAEWVVDDDTASDGAEGREFVDDKVEAADELLVVDFTVVPVLADSDAEVSRVADDAASAARRCRRPRVISSPCRTHDRGLYSQLYVPPPSQLLRRGISQREVVSWRRL
jgi:hypothetical protein